MTTKNVLIINQCSGNKGDRSVLYTLIDLFDKNSNLNITVSTSEPNDWNDSFLNQKIEFVPWGWYRKPSAFYRKNKIKFFALRVIRKFSYLFLRFALLNDLNKNWVKVLIQPEFRKALNKADLVISTGGHHITTILSENAVSSQIFDLACSLIYKKNLVIWSQSIGPLTFTNSVDKNYITRILNQCKAIYIRDLQSERVLKELNEDLNNIYSTRETVLSLAKNNVNYCPIENRNKTIGISIYSTGKRTPSETKEYINKLSSIVDYCVEKTNNEVVFLPMELKNSIGDDRWLINRIIKNSRFTDKISIYDEDMITYDHFAFIQNCQYFIGHKTHSVIYALSAGTPLIALAYHPKTTAFMEQFGVKEYSIPDTELTFEKFKKCFDEMIINGDEIGQSLFKKSKIFSSVIQSDFNTVLENYLY